MSLEIFLLVIVTLFSTQATDTRSINEELIAAVKKGDAETIKSLIDKGADVNFRARYGATALHFAADRGRLEIIRLLVEAGATVDVRDEFYKMTPTMMAIMRKHKDVIAYLQQAVVNQKESNSSKKASPDQNKDLIQAAKEGDSQRVMELLAKGANVNTATNYNQTPLMLAAGKGHLETVKILIDAGADLDVTDTFYKSITALSGAASGGHIEIVRLLLAKGAKGSESVLIAGVRSGNRALVEVALDHGEMAKSLLNRALSMARESDNNEIANLLAKAGAVAEPAPELKPEVQVAPELLKRYVGRYRLSDERQYTFILSDGKLSGWDVRQYSLPLTAIADNIFRIGNSDGRTVTFNEENGKIISMTLTQSGFRQIYKRVEGK